MPDYETYVADLLSAARQAAAGLAVTSTAAKDAVLLKAADGFLMQADTLKAANEEDAKAAESAGLSKAMTDRLRLSDKRLAEMAEGLRVVAQLRDPAPANRWPGGVGEPQGWE